MEVIRRFIIGTHGNLQLFVDRYSIAPGEDWEQVLLRALGTCEIVFVVWSKNSARSQWVAKEAELAIALNQASGLPKIVPIIIDNTELMIGLDRFQYIELPLFASPQTASVFAAAVFGILCAALEYLLYLKEYRNLLTVFLVIFIWTAVFTFSGLRESTAPWNKNSFNNSVMLFFGSICISRANAVVILASSLINALLAYVLLIYK